MVVGSIYPTFGETMFIPDPNQIFTVLDLTEFLKEHGDRRPASTFKKLEGAVMHIFEKNLILGSSLLDTLRIAAQRSRVIRSRQRAEEG